MSDDRAPIDQLAEQASNAAAESHDHLHECIRQRARSESSADRALIMAGIAAVGAYITYRLFLLVREMYEALEKQK